MTADPMNSDRFEGVIPTWAVPEGGDQIRVRVARIGDGWPVLIIQYRPDYYTEWSLPFAVPYVVTDVYSEVDPDEVANLKALERQALEVRQDRRRAYLAWVHPKAETQEFIHPGAGFHGLGNDDAED